VKEVLAIEERLFDVLAAVVGKVAALSGVVSVPHFIGHRGGSPQRTSSHFLGSDYFHFF